MIPANDSPSLSVSVLVTSYRRPKYLAACLRSIDAQTVPPTQVVVVMRDEDLETQQTVRQLQAQFQRLPIEAVIVTQPGVIAANNAAFPLLEGDVVAFLDDDSTAPERWIENLLDNYRDPSVGAVGGRIINHLNNQVLYSDMEFDPHCQRIDRFGRPHGGQMYPFDGKWNVESLTGSNMSFRRSLLAKCDETLFGDGFRYELDLCLLVIRSGYRVLLDAESVNEHWCAPRKQGPQRKDTKVVEAHSRYNEDYVLAKHGRSVWWVLSRRLVVRFPRDVIARLRGQENYPIRYLRSALLGWGRGMTIGRSIRRHQLDQLLWGDPVHNRTADLKRSSTTRLMLTESLSDH
ncbi:putative glycosyl transferase [Novipirellula aureliae]|uniref:Putative glycosyl transferase n=1 Tax=Novipirellula aureliae TaxID=2527966 RepID=A0A5C6E2C4_9BACT|nr:glycosyltransferase [Novipirellula aureliae]TWU41299.1 putative glycosyl transferase [Novipirellula aureliae]